MDETLTRKRAHTLQDILDARREKSAAAAKVFVTDDKPDTPRDDELDAYHPDGQDYRACGRVGNRILPSLRFILKDGSEQHAAYAHLDTRRPEGSEFIPSVTGKGNVIRLRFAGASSALLVEITGRNLRLVWMRIIEHLTPWVHEYPGAIDALGELEPVISSFTFTEIKEGQAPVRPAAWNAA
jgi:hypothetical protein